MANFLQASTIHDAIMDAFIETILDLRSTTVKHPTAGLIGADYVHYLYKHSSKGSPLRKFAVDFNLWSLPIAKRHCQKLNLTQYPIDFLHDYLQAAALFITSLRKVKHDPVNLEKSCDYHEHTLRGGPCYKVKHQYLAPKVEVAGT